MRSGLQPQRNSVARERLHPRLVLVEQAPQQLLRRQLRVEQLDILDGGEEGGEAFPIVVGALALRRRLQHDAAGAPGRHRRARYIERRGGEAQHGRQLLGLREIGFSRRCDAGGVELDDALIGLAAAPRLDGDRHRAVAGQRLERDGLGKRGEALGIDAAEAAQADRRVRRRAEIIGGDEIHRAVGLGLHREAAVELQRSAEDRGQRQSLADGARRGLGQLVRFEGAGGGGFEADDAAAQADGRQVERQNEVRGRRVGVGCGGMGSLYGIAVTEYKRQVFPALSQAFLSCPRRQAPQCRCVERDGSGPPPTRG